jgi:hypothetical protein
MQRSLHLQLQHMLCSIISSCWHMIAATKLWTNFVLIHAAEVYPLSGVQGRYHVWAAGDHAAQHVPGFNECTQPGKAAALSVLAPLQQHCADGIAAALFLTSSLYRLGRLESATAAAPEPSSGPGSSTLAVAPSPSSLANQAPAKAMAAALRIP